MGIIKKIIISYNIRLLYITLLKEPPKLLYLLPTQPKMIKKNQLFSCKNDFPQALYYSSIDQSQNNGEDIMTSKILQKKDQINYCHNWHGSVNKKKKKKILPKRGGNPKKKKKKKKKK